MPKVHLIGIGGAGMSAIAQILLAQGAEVSGSDAVASATTDRLTGWGARVAIGHSADNLGEPDYVVVSRAIPADNPELETALERGLPVLQRGEMLAKLIITQQGVVVAGTHGKTTTTSMVALVLERGGLDPAVLVGGTVPHLGGNARAGTGPYLVAEADESDGSFLLLHPHIGVVTNIEADHLEHWGSLDRIVDGFRQFLSQVHGDGRVVVCQDDPLLKGMARSARDRGDGRWVTYGLAEEADLMARDVKVQGFGSRAEVWLGSERLGVLELRVPGLHNLSNALAAVATGLEVGLSFKTIAAAMLEFSGAVRRFQLIGEAQGVKVVDDYGHHPSEVRATLRAARQAAEGRVVVCFQPHRYTRTKFLLEEFGEAFQEADEVFIADIYPASEKPIPGVTGQSVVDAIHRLTGRTAEFVPALADLPERVASLAQPGDLVLTLGAGNIWTVAHHILERLRESRAQTSGGGGQGKEGPAW